MCAGGLVPCGFGVLCAAYQAPMFEVTTRKNCRCLGSGLPSSLRPSTFNAERHRTCARQHKRDFRSPKKKNSAARGLRVYSCRNVLEFPPLKQQTPTPNTRARVRTKIQIQAQQADTETDTDRPPHRKTHTPTNTDMKGGYSDL